MTSFVCPERNYVAHLYVQNRPAGSVVVKNGKARLSVKAKGVTAIILDGVEVKTQFQHKLRSDAPKWNVNHTSVGFYDDKAVVFDFGEGLKSVYIWNESENEDYVTTVLHYSIDGIENTITKTGYPYEYTVPLSDESSVFEYWFEALTPEGKTVTSEKGRLEK